MNQQLGSDLAFNVVKKYLEKRIKKHVEDENSLIASGSDQERIAENDGMKRECVEILRYVKRKLGEGKKPIQSCCGQGPYKS